MAEYFGFSFFPSSSLCFVYSPFTPVLPSSGAVLHSSLIFVLATRVSCVDIGPTNCCRCSWKMEKKKRRTSADSANIFTFSVYSATYRISVRNAVKSIRITFFLSFFVHKLCGCYSSHARTHARNSKNNSRKGKRKKWIFIKRCTHTLVCALVHGSSPSLVDVRAEKSIVDTFI